MDFYYGKPNITVFTYDGQSEAHYILTHSEWNERTNEVDYHHYYFGTLQGAKAHFISLIKGIVYSDRFQFLLMKNTLPIVTLINRDNFEVEAHWAFGKEARFKVNPRILIKDDGFEILIRTVSGWA